MELTEGSVVLCTVKKIEKATVFVEIEDNGEGSIIFSEISAGRIRNIRDYVMPNKKIVCKVLGIQPGNIELSLRRVTTKEKEEVLDRYKREKSLINMLNTLTKEANKKIEAIKKEYSLAEFIEEIKSDSSILDKFFDKEEKEKIQRAITERIDRDKIVRKTITLSTTSSTGLTDIKDILKEEEIEIRYLGSSKFSIEAKAPDFKEANKKLETAISSIEKKAKQKHAILTIK